MHYSLITSYSPNGNMNSLAIVGKLMPVEVTQPSLFDDEEEEAPRTRGAPTDDTPSGSKGKRKAPDE